MMTPDTLLLRLRSAREPLLWLLALAAAAGTGFGTQRYLQASEARARAALEQRFRPTPVIVARSDLIPGSTLSPEVLAIRNVPSDYLPASTLQPAQAPELLGRTVAHAVRAGEPIQTALLKSREDFSLAQRVALGRRAVTIGVDEASAIAGLVRPGDRIDVRWRGGGRPLLNVAVLATGSQLTRGEGGKPQEYSTLTLELPEADAKRFLEREAGDLRVELRNPADTGDATVAKANGAVRPATASIPLITGGNGGPVPIVQLLAEGTP
jgi:pilus assembly protein CpaB